MRRLIEIYTVHIRLDSNCFMDIIIDMLTHKRPGAIGAIGKMSRIAMKTFGFSESSMADYDDSLFEVTRILRDGDADSLASIEKCRKIGAKHLFVPHHELLEDISNEEYFNRILHLLFKFI